MHGSAVIKLRLRNILFYRVSIAGFKYGASRKCGWLCEKDKIVLENFFENNIMLLWTKLRDKYIIRFYPLTNTCRTENRGVIWRVYHQGGYALHIIIRYQRIIKEIS